MPIKLYSDLAEWWPLLSHPSEYAEEAKRYWNALIGASPSPPRTILELGSGGGNNACHLKRFATLTLTDLSPGMLSVSRSLNPECEHLCGDMRSIRLDRLFDAIFVHDAIMYMSDEDQLRQSMATAHAHCKPGGVALFIPDVVRETFRSGTDHGGHDDPGSRRALRYLEWTFDPDPSDATFVVDFVLMLRQGAALPRVEFDRHTFGLFPRETWLRLLREVGFSPAMQDHESGQEMFVAMRSR
jgi:SAM-dependent methyltransferase